ncbi:iron-containing alcohol dehydrogenase [Paenibacillus naphthalenovorans]|uniref:iron-containing alcohol dehydrogenase n=1 Tax=Paenibacillus naphthalenovorans TaxID=162209 RepID=UPI003D2BEF84
MLSVIKNVTEIVWGIGAVEKVSELVAKNKARNVLVITDKGIVNSGVIRAVTHQLSQVTYEVFDEVEPNPSVRTVDKAVEICRRLNADMLIGVGGGSPIDVAKAVGVLHANGGSIVQYEGIDTLLRCWPFQRLPAREAR